MFTQRTNGISMPSGFLLNHNAFYDEIKRYQLLYAFLYQKYTLYKENYFHEETIEKDRKRTDSLLPSSDPPPLLEKVSTIHRKRSRLDSSMASQKRKHYQSYYAKAHRRNTLILPQDFVVDSEVSTLSQETSIEEESQEEQALYTAKFLSFAAYCQLYAKINNKHYQLKKIIHPSSILKSSDHPYDSYYDLMEEPLSLYATRFMIEGWKLTLDSNTKQTVMANSIYLYIGRGNHE